MRVPLSLHRHQCLLFSVVVVVVNSHPNGYEVSLMNFCIHVPKRHWSVVDFFINGFKYFG